MERIVYNPNFRPIYNSTPNVEEQYRQIAIQQSIRNKNLAQANKYRARAANFLSFAGGLISFIPHPIARGIGLALQAPDIINDVGSVVKDPNMTNVVHLGLDALPMLKFSKPINKVQNIMFNAPGIIDDGYSAFTGRDIINDSKSLFKTVINKSSLTNNYMQNENNKKIKIVNEPSTIKANTPIVIHRKLF